MQDNKKASAPSYHTSSARMHRIENDAATIIPFERKRRPTANELLNASRFKTGLAVGFLVATAIFVVVMYLWAIPTVDGAVAAAQQTSQPSAVLYA